MKETRKIGKGQNAVIQHKLDKVVATRIKELSLGLNGEKRHSSRALAMKIAGYECQMTGSDLVSLAQWSLNETWE